MDDKKLETTTTAAAHARLEARMDPGEREREGKDKNAQYKKAKQQKKQWTASLTSNKLYFEVFNNILFLSLSPRTDERIFFLVFLTHISDSLVCARAEFLRFVSNK